MLKNVPPIYWIMRLDDPFNLPLYYPSILLTLIFQFMTYLL